MSPRFIVIAFTLIAFLGQGFAFANKSCDMTSNSHQIISHQNQQDSSSDDMDHSKMSHAEMSHHGMTHSDTTNNLSNTPNDCCDDECFCIASACGTAALFAANFELVRMVTLNEAIDMAIEQQVTSLSSSLYRPPIFS